MIVPSDWISPFVNQVSGPDFNFCIKLGREKSEGDAMFKKWLSAAILIGGVCLFSGCRWHERREEMLYRGQCPERNYYNQNCCCPQGVLCGCDPCAPVCNGMPGSGEPGLAMPPFPTGTPIMPNAIPGAMPPGNQPPTGVPPDMARPIPAGPAKNTRPASQTKTDPQ
jgi:hypothetical protein